MAETKLNSNQLGNNTTVYNADNLVAGTNISIDDGVITGGIDEDTLACFHFEDNFINETQYASSDRYADGFPDSLLTYKEGKFGKSISSTQYNNNNHIIYNPAYKSIYDEITFEYWKHVELTGISAAPAKVALYGQTSKTSAIWNYISIYYDTYKGVNKFYLVIGAPGININRQLTNEEANYLIVPGFNHFAICCKKGEFIKFYINGHLIHSDTTNTSLSPYEDYSDGGFNFNFFDSFEALDEVRLSKCLRYTGDTFIVPDKPFDNSNRNVKKINNTMSAPSVMTGATSSTAGTSGLVPAPSAGDQTKYLTGAGTWQTVNALQNTSTGTNALTILGSPTTSQNAINIGTGSAASGSLALAIGESSNAQVAFSTAIGSGAVASQALGLSIGRVAESYAQGAIQIGPGSNFNSNTLSIGLGGSNNYELLNASGKIPVERMPATVVQSASITNIVKLTQAEYDALTTKDENTFYVIYTPAE